MKRKIIQIAIAPETESTIAVLYALCDDGTLWALVDNNTSEWEAVKPIPQDEPNNAPPKPHSAASV